MHEGPIQQQQTTLHRAKTSGAIVPQRYQPLHVYTSNTGLVYVIHENIILLTLQSI